MSEQPRSVEAARASIARRLACRLRDGLRVICVVRSLASVLAVIGSMSVLIGLAPVLSCTNSRWLRSAPPPGIIIKDDRSILCCGKGASLHPIPESDGDSEIVWAGLRRWLLGSAPRGRFMGGTRFPSPSRRILGGGLAPSSSGTWMRNLNSLVIPRSTHLQRRNGPYGTPLPLRRPSGLLLRSLGLADCPLSGTLSHISTLRGRKTRPRRSEGAT